MTHLDTNTSTEEPTKGRLSECGFEPQQRHIEKNMSCPTWRVRPE